MKQALKNTPESCAAGINITPRNKANFILRPVELTVPAPEKSIQLTVKFNLTSMRKLIASIYIENSASSDSQYEFKLAEKGL